MDHTRRALVVTYLTFTALILWFNQLYALDSPALYLKFGARLAMFLTVLFVIQRSREHKLVVMAFLCSLISDFFFSFLLAVQPDFANRDLFGIIGFIAAYLFLIAAFQRNFQMTRKEWFTVLPFVIVFLIVLTYLLPYADGAMLVSAIVLGVILCFTVMTMIATLYRGYFHKSVAWMIALAGITLFASDMVVAFSIFHPVYKAFFLWKENAIWGTYMIGWLLLLLACTHGDWKTGFITK
jgi:hypothetical protein